MNSKKLMLLAVMALTLFACPSDDDNPPTETTIEGTWELTELLVDTAVDFDMDGTASMDLISEIGCFDQTFTFNADNTGSADSTMTADFELELVFGTIDEFEYVIECIEESFSEPLTWTQDGNNISMNIDGDSVTGTIAGNMITFVLTDGADFETDENGVAVEVISDLTFVLTKQ